MHLELYYITLSRVINIRTVSRHAVISIQIVSFRKFPCPTEDIRLAHEAFILLRYISTLTLFNIQSIEGYRVSLPAVSSLVYKSIKTHTTRPILSLYTPHWSFLLLNKCRIDFPNFKQSFLRFFLFGCGSHHSNLSTVTMLWWNSSIRTPSLWFPYRRWSFKSNSSVDRPLENELFTKSPNDSLG